MEVNELMIGDWVLSFPDRCKVDGVICLREEHTAEEKWMVILHIGGNKYQQVNVGILEPIPLTPEILEKNRLCKTLVEKRDFVGHCFWEFHNSPTIMVRLEMGEQEQIAYPKRITYVHELQHALRLAGIKKEIVL